ncbi:Serine-threonine/tyrosine-protein kinase catalytic domain-containing protein, partial [Thalictrum thalictroides]
LATSNSTLAAGSDVFNKEEAEKKSDDKQALSNSSEQESMTSSETQKGTSGYNAPEKWIPTSVVTFKSDVYSFGMLLFEVLGRRRNSFGKEWFPIHRLPEDRPSMSSVVHMLEMEIPVMDPPNPFPFVGTSTSSSSEGSPRFNREASPSIEL